MKPLSFLARYYYSEGLMVILGIIALVIAIINYRRHRELRIFCYLLLFDLIQIGTDFWHYNRPGEILAARVLTIITLGFMVFENIACIVFVYSQLVSRRWKWTVAICPILFVVALSVAIKFKAWAQMFDVCLVDCITLTVPCLLYFYELFLYPSDKPLKDQPVFWVVTGILFLNCCSIPLYLTLGMGVDDSEKAFSLNCLLYAVYYGMLIRAYVCSPVVRRITVKEIAPMRLRRRGNIEPIN